MKQNKQIQSTFWSSISKTCENSQVLTIWKEIRRLEQPLLLLQVKTDSDCWLALPQILTQKCYKCYNLTYSRNFYSQWWFMRVIYYDLRGWIAFLTSLFRLFSLFNFRNLILLQQNENVCAVMLSSHSNRENARIDRNGRNCWDCWNYKQVPFSKLSFSWKYKRYACFILVFDRSVVLNKIKR